ncbi:MAG: hypothetical protein WD847_19515 [Pirellulales bacterium]
MTSLDRKAFKAMYCLAPVLVGLLTVALTVPASAAPRGKTTERRLKLGEYNPAHESVEMFQAMESGQIAVKFIPKDSTQARVMITNKTDKPLNVKLPEAFAAVPVLAQMGGMGGMGGGGGGMGGGGGGGQGMGGGMGGGGMGGGGGGMGGGMGMMNVPAEKVGRLTVTCICLEHGKAEPRPAIPYVIQPIDSFTDKPAVRELCVLLGSGSVSQRAAQAAAWNLASEMSWEELAAKSIKRLDGRRYSYFSGQELVAAMGIASQAHHMADRNSADQNSADQNDDEPAVSPGLASTQARTSVPERAGAVGRASKKN